MSRIAMPQQTLERGLAHTQCTDERDLRYWARLLAPKGLLVYEGDDHGIGRSLPYALAVIQVGHVAGEDYFFGPVGIDRKAIDHPVIVFSEELRKSSVGPLASNRQSDGNTYIYQLSSGYHYVPDNMRDFSILPSGTYTLEIMVPLFKIEPIVFKVKHGDKYRVSTSDYIYDSDELEENTGFMGIVEPYMYNDKLPSKGIVWYLPREADNMEKFELEMHRRGAVYFNGNYRDQIPIAPQEDLPTPPPERTSPDPADCLMTDDKADGDKENTPPEESPSSPLSERVIAWVTEVEDALIKVESESDEKPTPEVPSEPLVENSLKRKSRHDPDELWVERAGKRTKY